MSLDETFGTEVSRRSACKFIAIGGLATASAIFMSQTAAAQGGRKKPKIAERKHIGKHSKSYVDMNRDNPTSTAIHEDTITHRLNVPAWWKDSGEPVKYRLTEVFASELPGEGKTPEEVFVLTSVGGLVQGKRDKLQISRLSFLGQEKTKPSYWTADKAVPFMEDVIETLNMLEPVRPNNVYSVHVKFHPDRDWRGYKEILSHVQVLKDNGTLKDFAKTSSSNGHVTVYRLDVNYR